MLASIIYWAIILVCIAWAAISLFFSVFYLSYFLYFLLFFMII